MKYILYLIAVLLCVWSLAGCSLKENVTQTTKGNNEKANTAATIPYTQEASHNTDNQNPEQKEDYLFAVIEDITDQKVIVYEIGLNGEGDIRISPSRFGEVSEYTTGDFILVAYDGHIMETWPAKIGEIYSIEKLTPQQITDVSNQEWKKLPFKSETQTAYMFAMIHKINEKEVRISQIHKNGGGRGNIELSPDDFGNALSDFTKGNVIRIDYSGLNVGASSASIEKVCSITKM